MASAGCLEETLNWRKSEDDSSGHKKRYEHMLKSGIWSDVIFKVGANKQEVKAHKLILTAGSNVFEELFKEDASQSTFDVPDLEVEEFALLLKFLYTGESPTNVEDCLPAMNAAAKYEVPDLIRTCAKLLEQTLTPESAIKVFQQAIKYGDQGLEREALKCISKNGFKIVESPTFLELSVKELSKILEADELEVKNETQLFEAVMNWGRAELKRQKMPETPKYLRSVLEEVIYLIRFPQMDQADFSLKVYSSKILLDSDYIAVIMYFAVPVEIRTSAPSGPFNSKPRVAYSPQGEEFILERLILDHSEDVMDLVTNLSTGKQYIPSTSQEHSIRFKANAGVWVKSIGLNPVFGASYSNCSCYASTKSCDMCNVKSSDAVSVMIQLKTVDSRVISSNSETIDKSQITSDEEICPPIYHIKFSSPVFIRANEWYIASFTLSSGEFYGTQYKPATGDGTHLDVDVKTQDGIQKKIKFEFKNDGNPRYTGTTQGLIPEIAFMIE